MKSNNIARWLLFLCPALFLNANSYAFYNAEDGDHRYELRGLVRVNGVFADYPDNSFFYTKNNSSGLSEEARLLLDGLIGNKLSYEVNLQQAFVPESLLVSRVIPSGVERSASAHFEFSNHDVNELDLDRLNLKWSQGDYDVRIGRQAVNLATTFFFTPNDFFAPFAAQTFYRVYKPGVDALRADISMNELSQVSFITVLGYDAEPNSDTGWSDSPDAYRTSYLARATTVWQNFEWIALVGRVRKDNVIGFAASGEVFNWLGIRAEGHMARPRDDSSNTDTELSIGLEHRFENGLDLRFEWFYHGRGANSVNDYAAVSLQGDSAYLARQYTAFAASYQFTPLLIGSGVWLTNHVDQSHLLAFNAVYSLSDESELVFDVSLPDGDEPTGITINSEYGLFPKSLSIEYRGYF